MADELKAKRTKILTKLTRTRRNAFVLIESVGSRTALASYLPDLDKVLEELQEVNEKFAACLATEEEKSEAAKCFSEAEAQYEQAVARINEHLISRKDEAPSVVSGAASGMSKASGQSTLSKAAEITAKVKQLEAKLLEERLKQEKMEQEMQHNRKLQEAVDATRVAELEARLLKAAENDLDWERKDDFADNAVRLPGSQQPSDVKGDHRPGALLQNPQAASAIVHSLPRLTLPQFTGEPGQWPKWFALFKTLVDDQALSATEKMVHLQSAVSGNAQHTIAGMLCDGTLYEDALKALKDRFGREEDVIHASLKNVFCSPSPTYLDPVSLERFHASVHCLVTVFQSLGYKGDLESVENLRRVVEKLPSDMRRDWGEHLLNIEPDRPTLVNFDDWLRRQVRIALNYAASSPGSTVMPPGGAGRKQAPKPRGEYHASNRATLKIEASADEPSCLCREKQHKLTDCPIFIQLSPDQRAQQIADDGRCFFCLHKGHILRQCQQATNCKQDDCKMRHHMLLHGSAPVRRRYLTDHAQMDQLSQGTGSSDRVIAAASKPDHRDTTTLLQVVPVQIVGARGKKKTVCAMLDPGSQTSLCCKRVLEQLGLEARKHPLRLHNVEGPGELQITEKLPLEVVSLSSGKKISVPEVFAVKRINLTIPEVRKKHVWSHLSDLDIPDLSGQEVELLLGANVLEAVLQLEARVGKPGDPVALLTEFGWTLTGSVAALTPGHMRSVMFVRHADVLHDELKEMWTTEAFGCKFEGQAAQSKTDRKAQEIMERTTTMVDGHYEVGLLWKDADVKMPDNFMMAERRLQQLERNLLKRPEKASSYEEALMGYVENGYARKVSATEMLDGCPKRWFLPHHAVVNPNKTKVRVVFDAAAQYSGTSLNSALLTGPDLLQNLVGVMMRFREERIALMADVEQMFHQVRVREDDQPALSFLWRSLNRDKTPDIYQMQVVIFGAKCSPTLANFALRKTAQEHVRNDPVSRAAARAVTRNFYMDDFLKSETCTDHAKAMQKEMTRLLRQGGFKLTKWLSSAPEVMEGVKEESRSPSVVDLTTLGEGAERALGCVWKPTSDMLAVKASTPSEDVPATKRGVLKRVAMVFDPMGLVTPYVLRAKHLVQRLWALKYDWDERLTGAELRAWEAWLSEFKDLELIEIPRSYKSCVKGDVESYELHIFCDASEMAFGAVAYLRLVGSDGALSTAFVMSRSRLSPLKQLTIVRLELQGAVLGVRLADFVRKELDYPLSKVRYWTDSKVVLQFLNNESRRFHTFVANRVSEIQEMTRKEEWRYVPSDCNLADICSRGETSRNLHCSQLWWHGPPFLLSSRGDEWAVPEELHLDPQSPEVRVSENERGVFASNVREAAEPCIVDSRRYSSWLRYKRVIAWVLRFACNARRNHGLDRTVGPLSVEELTAAEICAIKASQRTSFGKELEHLEKRDAIPKESTLQHVSPFVDKQGIMRAEGRIAKSSQDYDMKNPIIVGKDADVLRLIVDDAHRRVMHAGLEHTLSEVRMRFYIPKARMAVKKVLQRCRMCHKRRCTPRVPRMGDLPDTRVKVSRPFEHCGLDYCGPFYVKKYRKTEKRYVLLITCLASRAIHLEMAGSLETDCFLMALRRFVARRGHPVSITSDNGTNFVSGERELRETLRSMDQARISDEMSSRSIQWTFLPPTASHMGGVWERLVASVKRALRTVLGPHCVSEDVLHTALTEVEHMLNSRPLTYASGDARDPDPLTPNHFLLGMPQAAVSPGAFTAREVMSRSKWRQSQALVDQLWRRWQREYLPLLLPRKKWNNEVTNIAEGDVVLMAEETSPRGLWPLARVIEVVPGEDGRVRSVKVQTASKSVYHRPVSRICVLERCGK